MTCFRKITVEAIVWKGDGWTGRTQLLVPLGEVTRPFIKALPVKMEARKFYKMTTQTAENF